LIAIMDPVTSATSQNEESDVAAGQRWEDEGGNPVPVNCGRHDQSPNRMRRAAGCQCSSDYERLDMTGANLIERNSLAKGESASAVEAAIRADNPVSKNNYRQ
jgi:hypothetical protein